MGRGSKIYLGILTVLAWIFFVTLTTMVTKFIWGRTDAGFNTILEYAQEVKDLNENIDKRVSAIDKRVDALNENLIYHRHNWGVGRVMYDEKE